MQLRDKPDEGLRPMHEKIKAAISPDNLIFITTTVLGMSELAHKYIYDKMGEWADIPSSVQYSLIQHASIMRVFYLIVNDMIGTDKIVPQHFPIVDREWDDSEDYEAKFIFLIKTFYDQLKEQGKI